MNRNRSKKGRGCQIPLFINKLLEMVENNEIAPIISWTSSGDSFNIKNISKFTEEVLPQYFKHRNFSSFIRQLNMYGFRKVRHPQGENVYMHQHFKNGANSLLKNINRKIRQEKEERIVVYQGTVGRLEGVNLRQVHELKTKQKNLEQMCKHFILENQRLMQENQNIVKRMEEEAKEKESRLEQFLIMLLSQKNTKAISSQQPLSISDQEHPQIKLEDQQHTPLQNLANNFMQNDHMQNVRSLLEGIYGKRSPTKRRDHNYTIISQQQQDNHSMLGESVNDLHHSVGLQFEKDDSFLSINDFINADDYDNEINLQQSR